MDQRDLRCVARKEQRLLDRRVAAADDRHLLALEQRAVAGGARRHAAVRQPLLGRQAEPLGRRASRQDHRVGGEGSLGRLDAERPLREVDPRRVLLVDARAEALRLLLEALHHVRSGQRLGKAGVVLDVRRQHQLPADRETRDDDRLQLRACGVQRRRPAGRTRPDDHELHMLGRTAAARAEPAAGDPEQAVELPGLVERRKVIEAADVALPDPDLRHGPLPAALDHLVAPTRLRLDVDLGPGLPLRREQALGHVAVRAGRLRVDRDCGHRTSGGAVADEGG